MRSRWVFARRAAGVLMVVLLWRSQPAAAELTPDAIASWTLYAAAADARLEHDQPSERVAHPPAGESVPVPGGTIHVWRGSVLVRGIHVNQLLDMLMHPGTPPPQDDILASRVLARSNDSLRLYLKLVRRAIVTVTYDTEHQIVFSQHSATMATSRSTATRISEVGGGDHGFLWRLNSYWRYVQVGDDVLVELESLSLSRDVPAIVRPVVAPLISRIGRESMTRTLQTLKTYVEGMTAWSSETSDAFYDTMSRDRTRGRADVCSGEYCGRRYDVYGSF